MKPTWRYRRFQIGVGSFAGFLSGMLGIGGGLIVGPALVLAGISIKKAVGTSLVIVAPVAAVGVAAEFFSQPHHLVYSAALFVMFGGQIGAWLGAHLLLRMPEKQLRWAFVLVLVYTALNNFGLFGALPADAADAGWFGDSFWWKGAASILLGVFAGIAASLFGVGGGVVVVPGLVYLIGGFSFHEAAGTSLLAMVPTAARAAFLAARQGRIQPRVAPHMLPAALVCAVMGVLMRNWILDDRALAILFGIFLLYVAVQLIRRPTAGR